MGLPEFSAVLHIRGQHLSSQHAHRWRLKSAVLFCALCTPPPPCSPCLRREAGFWERV